MIFYDFEVFKYDWLVVVIDMKARQEHVIVNDKKQLEQLYNEQKQNIWVGFNSTHYDQYILKGILCGFNPKEINDWIIRLDKPGWAFSNALRDIPLNNYDVMSRTDRGLKAFEGFMGNSIKESSIPFDIDRKLTPAEIAETIKYCRHDVEQTVEVFLRKKEDFDTMMYFINHFSYPLSYISKTKAQLASEILGGNGRGQNFNDEFDFPLVDCLQLKKYKHIADWYKRPENQDYTKSQKEIVAGVEHIFAWGGGHGAIPKYCDSGIFLIIDVTAYYPSQQKQFKFGYRVMNNPENFEFIHDSNIEFKRKGDKKARQPFKIMDNAISGQMKQKSSKLYDPMSNNSICINGQLMLLDLVEHLEPYCKLIQNNTDGIIVKLKNYDDFDIIDDVVYEWECRTGLKMDIDQFFGDIYQKDVNNYLIVDRETGAMKSKGAYIKSLNDLDYDLPIVNKAMVEFMVSKTPVEQTIMSCNDLKEFQQIKKISSKYKCILYGGVPLNERCIRVFASKDVSDLGLEKVHAETGRKAKLEGTPEHCFIVNGNVNDLKCSDYKNLNKRWYIELARKRLTDFGVM